MLLYVEGSVGGFEVYGRKWKESTFFVIELLVVEFAYIEYFFYV